MPNIKPISDLRNYTEVLKQVDASKRVYLTRMESLPWQRLMSLTAVGQLIP